MCRAQRQSANRLHPISPKLRHHRGETRLEIDLRYQNRLLMLVDPPCQGLLLGQFHLRATSGLIALPTEMPVNLIRAPIVVCDGIKLYNAAKFTNQEME